MRRIGSVALGLLLLVAVLFVTRTAPTYEQQLGNIATSGRIGDLIDTRGFKLRVERVHTAKRVVSSSALRTEPFATKGIWVVIAATLIGDWKATSYSNTRLTTPDGRIYHPTRRLGLDLLTEDGSTEPGIPRRGVILFEIPPDALEGSVLQVAKGTDSRLGPEAIVDLRLSAAAAQRLLDDASPSLTLPKTGLGE
ncbi:DUF4352 domain-containing protein [Tenggerimyces flavus]|uniref:DUF4352 domain-containing protein n=1 Tax=Tenggerimyces flavus TaxID=1708749 RepID=A0ABV7Y7H5_9ACTN|nr:hypothetical protein [Tenggerimyces flavus]MBM7785185.1 hypothetical protein [Tenggerimyces flavus]